MRSYGSRPIFYGSQQAPWPARSAACHRPLDIPGGRRQVSYPADRRRAR